MRRTGLCFVLLMAAGCGPRELHVTMNPDNNSGQRGFAVITDEGNSITVVVETNAPDVPGEQQVHIHKGNCGEIEGIYAPLLSLVPLKDPSRVGSTSTQVLKKGTSELVQFKEFAT